MQRIFGWWSIAGLSAGLCGAVWAQEITGSVFGSVVDMSGAIVSGATVTVENADKNDAVIRVVMTNENGDFVVQFLPIGHYTFVAEAKGFKKAERRGSHASVASAATVGRTPLNRPKFDSIPQIETMIGGGTP